MTGHLSTCERLAWWRSESSLSGGPDDRTASCGRRRQNAPCASQTASERESTARSRLTTCCSRRTLATKAGNRPSSNYRWDVNAVGWARYGKSDENRNPAPLPEVRGWRRFLKTTASVPRSIAVGERILARTALALDGLIRGGQPWADKESSAATSCATWASPPSRARSPVFTGGPSPVPVVILPSLDPRQVQTRTNLSSFRPLTTVWSSVWRR